MNHSLELIVVYSIIFVVMVGIQMIIKRIIKLFTKKEVVKPSTKQCPLCGNDKLVLLRSTYQKGCNNHGGEVYYFPWPLDEGQNSIIGNNRQKKQLKEENINDK